MTVLDLMTMLAQCPLSAEVQAHVDTHTKSVEIVVMQQHNLAFYVINSVLRRNAKHRFEQVFP